MQVNYAKNQQSLFSENLVKNLSSTRTPIATKGGVSGAMPILSREAAPNRAVIQKPYDTFARSFDVKMKVPATVKIP